MSNKLKELREALDSESISYGELAEIDAMAASAGIVVTEDMMADDILRELEAANLEKSDFTFTVTVTCETMAEAEQVMTERLGHDETYGFDYDLDWHH